MVVALSLSFFFLESMTLLIKFIFKKFFFAGVLFCVGGRGASGDPFKSIEVYDPRRNRWFQVSEMNTRRRHVGVCCSGGQLEDIDLLYNKL